MSALGTAIVFAFGTAACTHQAPPPVSQSSAAPVLVVQQGTSTIILDLAVDPQARLLASVSFDGIRLWDLNTGRILRTFSPLHPGTIDGGDVAFSSDGATLVNTSGKSRRAFDVATGAPVDAPSALTPPLLAHHSGTCDHHGLDCVVVYSPDGHFSLTASQRHEDFYAPNAPIDRLPLQRLELRALPSRRLLRAWQVTDASYVCEGRTEFFCAQTYRFSPTGRYVAIQTAQRRITIVDLQRPAHSEDFDLAFGGAARSGKVEVFTFTPAGDSLFAGDDVGDIVRYDVLRGVTRPLWDARSQPSESGLAASPNGKWLVTGVGDHSELWDLATGQPAINLRAVCHPVFSLDSRRLACLADRALTVWNVASGTPILESRLPKRVEQGYELTDAFADAAFSPDASKLFYTADQQRHRGDWTNRYALLMDIAKRKTTIVSGNLYAGVHVCVDRDGRRIAWLERQGTIRRFDFSTGSLAQIGRLPPSLHSPFGAGLPTFLDGGMASGGRYAFLLPYLAVDDPNTGFAIYDTVAQKQIGTADRRAADLLSFTPDGSSAMVANQDNAVAVVDLATARVTHRYIGHTNKVYAATYARNGRTLLTAASDNTIAFWDAQTERRLGLMFPGAGGPDDWLSVASNGSFDGSPGGWGAMLWRFGGRTLDVTGPEPFFNDYFDPGLLSGMVQRQLPAVATLATIDRRQPHVAMRIVSPQPYGRTVRIRLVVAEAPPDATHASGSGARDIRLMRNGSLVHFWPGNVLNGSSSTTLETSIRLTASFNALRAYGFNDDGVRSGFAGVNVAGPPSFSRSTAYVLAIGVNRSANADFSLHYAASDAAAFAHQLGIEETRLYGPGTVDAVELIDARATKSAILAALARLAQRVRPEDVVYIYFAGHGVADNDRYYLVPYDIGYAGHEAALDAVGYDTILKHSLSDLELARAVLPIDAGRLVFVIDACQSGKALGNAKRIGPMNAKGLAQLAYDKGMYVLAAAQGDQAAIEASKYGHGLLTYALIEEGLKRRKAADPENPGYLSLRQWLGFAQQRVPALQVALMQDAARAGRSIAIVPGESRTIAEPEERTLQRPRVFYPPYAEDDRFAVATFPRR